MNQYLQDQFVSKFCYFFPQNDFFCLIISFFPLYSQNKFKWSKALLEVINCSPYPLFPLSDVFCTHSQPDFFNQFYWGYIYIYIHKIKPVNFKGNQPWILIERTDAEAETPVFWLSNVNSWLIGKVPDAGKDWRQKEKRVSKDETARRHHWCNEYELGQTSGDGEGQKPGVLQSMGSQRVGRDWATKHSTHTHTHISISFEKHTYVYVIHTHVHTHSSSKPQSRYRTFHHLKEFYHAPLL